MSPAMSDLTSRQAEILDFIRRRLDETGFPPTREDIAREFGFSSKTGAQDHLQAIARKGHIELVAGNARGIRLLRESPAASRAGSRVEMQRARQFELPLVGRIAAGTPLTAETNVDTWLRVDPELFSPRADFLHRVSGHSMQEADILDGDLVGIHAQEEAANGSIVAAVLAHPVTGEDEITLKRYFRRGSRIVLKPENSAPAYKPIEIDLAQPELSQEQSAFRIAGIFAGLIRVPR